MLPKQRRDVFLLRSFNHRLYFGHQILILIFYPFPCGCVLIPWRRHRFSRARLPARVIRPADYIRKNPNLKHLLLFQAEKQAQAQAQAVAAAGNPGVPDMQQAAKWGYAQLQYPVGPGADRVIYASNPAPNTSSTNDLYASTRCTLPAPQCTCLS